MIRTRIPGRRMLGSLLMLALVLVVLPVVAGDDAGGERLRVTIQNLADAQPLSPPIVATHRPSVGMFGVGRPASPGLEAIAEDGNGALMFGRFSMIPEATEAVDAMRPLTPAGTTVGDFTDTFEFDISASPGDRLSMATMLICTNDGFTGLDAMHLPAHGSVVRLAHAYDAGTEDNTEASVDIVDPCSALGPVALAGDPNGNIDDAVDTQPRKPIGPHPGILELGDLLAAHDWDGPIAKVTVTRIDPAATMFTTPLAGVSEVPPVQTMARGAAVVRLIERDTRSAASFALRVGRIVDPVQAHIHLGSPAENGPVVAFLYGPEDPTGATSGLLAEGVITEDDLIGPLAGDIEGFVEALRDGQLYVNVHTVGNPGGEIRGQLGAQPGFRPLIVRPDGLQRPGSRLPGR